MATASPRYLLLQGRRLDDPMRLQEIECFARAISAAAEQITALDLLRDRPTIGQIEAYDVVFVGGSGDYSIADDQPWTDDLLATMQGLYDRQIPTFASCWGFQAMARALGGQVVTDLARAELGTLPIELTDEGLADPLFSHCDNPLLVQLGHQDIVTRLPSMAVHLALSPRVENEAFCFPDRLMYCTQFHPELTRADLQQRCRAYPEYVEKIAGVPIAVFLDQCQESPQADALIPRFLELVLQHNAG